MKASHAVVATASLAAAVGFSEKANANCNFPTVCDSTNFAYHAFEVDSDTAGFFPQTAALVVKDQNGAGGISATGNGTAISGVSAQVVAVVGTATGPGAANGVLVTGVAGYSTSTNNSSGPLYGVYGRATSAFPSAGVYGTSTASSNGIGVRGNVDHGTGLEGTTVDGNGAAAGNSGSGGTGVYGWTTGTNSKAIHGVNYGGSTSWAGYFGDPAQTGSGSVNVTTSLTVNGTCIAGSCSSDIRLKNNVRPLTGALDRVVNLRPVTFEWKSPEEHGGRTGTQKGFIAQEVEKVIPEWVGIDDKGFKTIDTRGIEATAMLVESIRTLKAENDALKIRVSAVERGRAPVLSYLVPGSLGGLALGLVPLGLVAARRKRGRPES